MTVYIRQLLIVLCLCPAVWAQAQDTPSNTFEGQYTRPIHDVIEDVCRRFGVTINVEVDTVGVTLRYADSRIRPYSVEETLTNVLKPLDYRWEKKGRTRYVVRPYDYPRRTFAEGEAMVAYLGGLYADSAAWAVRRDTLMAGVRRRLDIDRWLDARVDAPRPILSKVRKMRGYTVQNFAIETLPGLYVCGSIYTPAGRRGAAHPVIICPNGHFANGRYNDEQQLRKATLARMGAVCVDYDIIGWGESEMQLGIDAHRTAYANTLQLVNGITVLDYIIGRSDIDAARVGVNGGSGGGTQAIYLAMLDDRITAVCPTVSLAAHFDGGCPCESGRAATLAASGTCHAEIAACLAPRPMCVISDTGDWTANVPTVEYPYLQRIYDFYGASERVTNVHLEGERHDFGPNKRRGVYDFFASVFSLDDSAIDEAAVTVEDASAMQSFGDISRFPHGAVSSYDEFLALLARLGLAE